VEPDDGHARHDGWVVSASELFTGRRDLFRYSLVANKWIQTTDYNELSGAV
jgi:hypothetical protein